MTRFGAEITAGPFTVSYGVLLPMASYLDHAGRVEKNKGDVMKKVTLEGHVEASHFLALIDLSKPENCVGKLRWLVDLRRAEVEVDAMDAAMLSLEIARYRKQTTSSARRCRVALLALDDRMDGIVKVLNAYLRTARIDIAVVATETEGADWLTYEEAESAFAH